MKPIELLKQQLFDYEKALHKSKLSFDKKLIDLETYKTKKKNLTPTIFEYKQAIQILENWI